MMTPIGDPIPRIVSRVLDRRQRPDVAEQAPTMEAPLRLTVAEFTRMAERWAEPEADTPLFDAPDATAAWPRDLFEPGRKP